MAKKYLQLNDISAYKTAFHLSNYRYSQGSLKECYDWLHKSKERNLLQGDEYQFIFAELEKLPMDISSLIAYTNRVLKE